MTVWQVLQWRVCHVLRPVILRWNMSQAGATVIPTSITPLWVFSHWFVVVRNFSSVPPYAVHFLFTLCANKPPTRISVLKVLFIWVCCVSVAVWLTQVKRHLRAGLDESCVQITSCHQLSPLTDGSLQSLKWIWSLQLFDVFRMDDSMTAACLV